MNENAPTRRPKRVITWVVLALLALAWAALGRYAMTIADRPTNGFLSYYTAARLAREGRFGPRVYDDAWFAAEGMRSAPGVRDIMGPNPPTMPFLLLPASGLSYVGARRLVVGASLVALAMAAALLSRSFVKGGWERPAFLLLAAAWPPVWANLRNGQAYALLLLLAAVFLASRARPVVSGAALGLSAGLKSAFPFLWLVPLRQRNWRQVLSAVATAGSLGVASLAFANWVTWKTYFRYLGEFSTRPELAVTAYQSQVSLVRHLFARDALWNPSPLLDAPLLSRGLSAALLIASAAYVLWLSRPGRREDLAVAGALLASLAQGPLSMDYHFVLVLLPAAILGGDLAGGATRGEIALLFAGLVFSGFPFARVPSEAGLWALFAYPRLLGVWLLAGLCAIRARQGTVVNGDSAGRHSERRPGLWRHRGPCGRRTRRES